MTESADHIYQQLLVLRCQTGDELALAELIARFDRRLRYYLRQMLGDGIDDVLQEVWIDVWRGIGNLAQPQAFATWVYTIARRRAQAHAKRLRPLPTWRDESEVADAQVDGADDECFTAEDAARIHAGLAQLSAEHREVLTLRFLEDLSYDQIAEVIGCATGTVKSRIYYAKRDLRRVWETTRER